MADYPSTSVHQDHSDRLRIEIHDSGELRSLYFSEGQLQSRMCLSRPWELILPYTRYMAGALLLVPELRRIALIGLGAGSLAHFFLHHFPECHLDCAENSSRVIDLARGFFRLPHSERMAVECCDGLAFVKDSVHAYDILLVDAFDQEGMAASIYGEDFFTRCSELLTGDGVMVCNLWSSNRPRLQQLQEALTARFTTVWYLPVPKRGNIVAWACHQETPWKQLLLKRKHLAALSQRYAIDFREIVTTAKSNNLNLAQRLILAWL